MTDIVKETITTQGRYTEPIVTTEVKAKATSYQTIEYLLYFVFGVLEVLLTLRLVLKLLGAGVTSSFVDGLYRLSGIFITPFEGIFRRGVSQGIETSSVLEPATVVAIVVYALVVWGIVTLLRISSGDQQNDN